MDEERRKYFRDYHYRNRHRRLAQMHQRDQALKTEVMWIYGGGRAVCVMCGENRLACLSIDHIAGGGNTHRQGLRKQGREFYAWLRKQGFPEGYQTLCMNCQFVKKDKQKEYGKRDCNTPVG